MNKKIVLGIVVILTVAAFFGGCGKKVQTANEESITIRMTYAPGELDSINRDGDAVFAEFYEKYPNVTVEFEEGGTTMMAKIAANDAPDIIRATPYDLPTYVNKNIIMPLDDYLEKSELYDEEDIYPAAINAFRYDGKEFARGSIYGLAKDWSPNVLWVNKAAFEEAGLRVPTIGAPMTLDEFEEAVTKLSIKDGKNIVRFGIKDEATGWMSLVETMLNMIGKSIWSDDYKTIDLKSKESMRIIRCLFNLRKDGSMPSSLNPLADSGQVALTENKIAMFMSALYAGSAMNNNPNKTVQVDDIELTPFVVMNDKTSVQNMVVPTGAVISARTEHPDEVFACWEYIHLGPLVEKRASTGLNIPVKKSVASRMNPEDPFINRNLKSALKLAENEATIPRLNPYATGASGVFGKYLDPALAGEYSLEEAIDIIQSEIQILIDEGINNAE